jgi:hypothetical protein
MYERLSATDKGFGKEDHSMNNSSKIGRLFYCLLVLVGGVLTMAPTPGNLKTPL